MLGRVARFRSPLSFVVFTFFGIFNWLSPRLQNGVDSGALMLLTVLRIYRARRCSTRYFVVRLGRFFYFDIQVIFSCFASPFMVWSLQRFLFFGCVSNEKFHANRRKSLRSPGKDGTSV